MMMSHWTLCDIRVLLWICQIRCASLLVLSYFNYHDDECYRCAGGVQNKTLIIHIQ